MNTQQDFFGADWLVAQQKYWDAWLELTRRALMAPTPQAPPDVGTVWADGLNRWWDTIAGAAPPAAQEFYAKLLDLGRMYVGFAEQVSLRSDGAGFAQWLDSIQRAFLAISESGGAVERQLSDAVAFWGLPLTSWQRTLSSMLPNLDALTQLIGTPGVVRDVEEGAQRLLSMPTVGYARETQEQYQKLSRLIIDYNRAQQDYCAAFARVGLQSTEHFRQQVEATAQTRPIASIRALYDIWVDACEEIYGRYVMSEEYTLLYGRTVNALMAIKRQQALLVDKALEQLNLPTRRELDTVHQRMHQMRRDVNALRAEVDLLRQHLVDRSGAHSTHLLAAAAAPRTKGARKQKSS